MSNVLPAEKRLNLLAALVDGNSERAVSRIASVDRETVGRYAVLLGTAAQHLHNAQAFGLSSEKIEQDEIWSYVGKKQARVTPEEHAAGFGEAYTFVSLGMPSRYVIAWKVGKRDQETANAFEADTRARLVLMPAITSDGFNAYPLAIGEHFGPGVDYGQTIKNYTKSGRRDDDHRYEPPRDPFVTKKAVFGAPNMDEATTAHIERNNGTMRQFIGRMRRLVYAFSKSPVHHAAAVALAYVYYNLCWIPRSIRVTPAMAIGVTAHPWELEELLDALMSARPCEAPIKQPLAPRKPATTARELPNGRGFLRVVGSSGPTPEPGGPAAPPPEPGVAVASSSGPGPTAPTPASLSAAPSASYTPAPSTAADALPGQYDLLSWRPRPAVPVAPSKRLPLGQLGLFGIDFEPE